MTSLFQVLMSFLSVCWSKNSFVFIPLKVVLPADNNYVEVSTSIFFNMVITLWLPIFLPLYDNRTDCWLLVSHWRWMNRPPLHPPEEDHVALYTNSLYFLSDGHNNQVFTWRWTSVSSVTSFSYRWPVWMFFWWGLLKYSAYVCKHVFVTQALLLWLTHLFCGLNERRSDVTRESERAAL